MRSGNLSAACRAASVSPHNAKRWLYEDPDTRAYYSEQKRLLAQKTAFGATEAMKELDEAIDFARETGNANALAKCIELRMKLHGLLIDKHEVRQASLTIAIGGITSISDPLPLPHDELTPSADMPLDQLPPVPLPMPTRDDDIFK